MMSNQPHVYSALSNRLFSFVYWMVFLGKNIQPKIISLIPKMSRPNWAPFVNSELLQSFFSWQSLKQGLKVDDTIHCNKIVCPKPNVCYSRHWARLVVFSKFTMTMTWKWKCVVHHGLTTLQLLLKLPPQMVLPLDVLQAVRDLLLHLKSFGVQSIQIFCCIQIVKVQVSWTCFMITSNHQRGAEDICWA